MNIELVLDAQAIIGESPLWVPPENALYWADIKAPALHRLSLSSGESKTWKLPADLGGYALDGHGRALAALRNGLQWLDLNTGALSLIAPPPFDSKIIRFNESACDSAGRFWVGSMTDPPEGVKSDEKGMLYSYCEKDGLTAHMDFAFITNGMAFNHTDDRFYVSHSTEREIFKFDYDAAAGKIGKRHDYVALGNEPGIPDGAALDAEQHYWCALHGGGRLARYTPGGTLSEVIELPVSQPTMCCFAGDNLEELYITSAREKLSAENLKREPHAGGIFKLKPGVSGQPKHWRVF